MSTHVELRHRSTQGRLPTSTFDLVLDGEVIGFAQVRHRPSHNADLPPEAGNNIYYEISEPHRGRGYGKQLFGLALAEAKRIGLSAVRVTVLSDNPVSRHVIESHGAQWVADFVTAKGETYSLLSIDLSTKE
jgi:predicted acetyltransferase